MSFQKFYRAKLNTATASDEIVGAAVHRKPSEPYDCTVRGESICAHTHGGSSVLFAPRQRRGTTAFMARFYRSFKPTVSRETRCRRCCNGIPTMPGNYSLRVGAVLSSSHDHTLLMFSREPSGMCVSYYSRSRKRLELGLSRKPGTSLSSLPFWRGFRISFGSV